MPSWHSSWHYRNAARSLKQGGVIAYPTEAVWGLGCDPFNETAVMRLLAVKQRAVEKGLILIAADIEQISPWLQGLTSEQIEQLHKSWPGFQTWVLPNRRLAPFWVTGEHAGIAIRVSAHPLVQKLCRAFGGPIVSTSANPAARPSALSRLRLEQYFAKQLDYVLPGALGGARRASPIVNLVSGEALR